MGWTAGFSAAAWAEDAQTSVVVELNRLEHQGEACRAYLLLDNSRGAAWRSLKLDVFVLDGGGVVAKRLGLEDGAARGAQDVTEQLIRDQQVRTVGDVFAYDPSVRQVQSPFGLQPNIYNRGILVSARDFAFDGLFGIVNVYRPAVEGVEGIEVLNGPGSLLYGSSPADVYGRPRGDGSPSGLRRTYRPEFPDPLDVFNRDCPRLSATDFS